MSAQIDPEALGLVDPTAPRRAEPIEAPGLSPSTTARIALVDGMLNKGSDWGRGILDAAEARLRLMLPSADFERIDLDPIRPLPPDLWASDIADRCQAVVIAAGDCITCTSRGVQSAIAAERLGLPAVVVTTPAVSDVVDSVCASRGVDAIRVLLVTRSLFGLSRDAVASIADEALDGLADGVTRGRTD